MKQSEVIEMAEQSGVAFASDEYPDIWQTYMHVGKQEIEAFAKLVAAKATQAEKERCEKIARLFYQPKYGSLSPIKSTESNPNHVALEIEATIRARGQA